MIQNLVRWLERRLSFVPYRKLARQPQVPFQSSFVRTSDQLDIHYWLLEHPSPVADVVFFHGNRGNLGTWCPLLELIQFCGVRVTALDYRGYGRSQGQPTEQGLYLDVEAFLGLFWAQLHDPNLPVVYWGRSLGGVTAARACQRREPDALVLEGTFSSKDRLLQRFKALHWLSRFSEYEFPTMRFLADRTCPVLVIHALQDAVIPFEAGKELYNDLSPPKEFFAINGPGHGKVHETEPARYWKRVRTFLQGIAEH